jgi:hypothetical protein
MQLELFVILLKRVMLLLYARLLETSLVMVLPLVSVLLLLLVRLLVRPRLVELDRLLEQLLLLLGSVQVVLLELFAILLLVHTLVEHVELTDVDFVGKIQNGR